VQSSSLEADSFSVGQEIHCQEALKTVLYVFKKRDFVKKCGPGSSVGIATGYGLGGPGIESQWGERFSAPFQTGPGTHPASCKTGTGTFLEVQRPGRDADPSPPSSAVVKKEYSYTSTPAMGRTACTEPQSLYKGAL
jgi:hypothetical protein